MHHKTRGAEAKERGKISLFEKSSVCHFGGLKAKKRLLPKYCCQNIAAKILVKNCCYSALTIDELGHCATC